MRTSHALPLTLLLCRAPSPPNALALPSDMALQRQSSNVDYWPDILLPSSKLINKVSRPCLH